LGKEQTEKHLTLEPLLGQRGHTNLELNGVQLRDVHLREHFDSSM
jgi:hypothetical protein